MFYWLKFSPHVPITILIWVWEKKVQIFIMGLLLPHFKNFSWALKTPNFHFWNMAKIKNWSKLGHFWSKWLQILYSSWVFPKKATLVFWPKKLVHKPNCWQPFCMFAKNLFFDFWGPLHGPKTDSFPIFVSKVALNIFRKSQSL